MEYTIKGNGHSLSLTGVCIEAGANNHNTVRFIASVKSWGFSGSTDFCADLSSFCAFITELTDLHDNPRGLAILQSSFETQFMRFRPEQLGYTEVSGKLIRYYPKNAVEFEFLIDQVEMNHFVQSLYRDFSDGSPPPEKP